MSLSLLLSIIFAAAITLNAVVAAAVIYHLIRYTLPGWTLAKLIVPLYVIGMLIAAGLALSFIMQTPDRPVAIPLRIQNP